MQECPSINGGLFHFTSSFDSAIKRLTSSMVNDGLRTFFTAPHNDGANVNNVINTPNAVKPPYTIVCVSPMRVFISSIRLSIALKRVFITFSTELMRVFKDSKRVLIDFSNESMRAITALIFASNTSLRTYTSSDTAPYENDGNSNNRAKDNRNFFIIITSINSFRKCSNLLTRKLLQYSTLRMLRTCTTPRK